MSEREDRETYRNASRKLDLIIYDFNLIYYLVNIKFDRNIRDKLLFHVCLLHVANACIVNTRCICIYYGTFFHQFFQYATDCHQIKTFLGPSSMYLRSIQKDPDDLTSPG